MFQAEQYFDIYYISLCVIILFTFLHYSFSSLDRKLDINVAYKLCFIFIALPTTFFLGFRPISKVFGDMLNYEEYFIEVGYTGKDLFHNSDILFTKYIELSSSVMNVNSWFFLTAFITIGFQFWAVKRLFPNNVYLYFLAILSSLSFYVSVINGLRSGMAVSIFLFGLSLKSKPIKMYLLFLIAIGIHKSLALPVIAYLITYFYSNTKVLVKVWFFAVVLSLFVGNYFGELFASLNFDGDVRYNNYLLVLPDASKFSSIGFRYDFVIYSVIPILIWFIYYFKKNKQMEVLYKWLLNIYIVANIFWILLMYVNFANRFASLSWFLWPILVLYPILESSGDKKSQIQAITIIFAQTILSYVLQN